MITKSELEFERAEVGPGTRCWQIDSDRVPPPLDSGEWETVFAEVLIDLAEAHEASSLTCFFYLGASVEFGYMGFSVWVALAGPGPLVRAAGDLLQEIIPPECLRASSVDQNAHWQPRIRVAEGKVWRPLDAVDWFAISAADDQVEQIEGQTNQVGDSMPELGGSGTTDATKRRRKKLLNAARDDVRVGYYQRKIERLLSLPEGSVKLVNPDRSISHPAQLIGTLRGRWADE
jgi:hypothetical protein